MSARSLIFVTLRTLRCAVFALSLALQAHAGNETYRVPPAMDHSAQPYAQPVLPSFLPSPMMLPAASWLPLEPLAAEMSLNGPRPYEVVGTVRDLPTPLSVVGSATSVSSRSPRPFATTTAQGGNALSLGIESSTSHGLRFHVRFSGVPHGTQAWVAADGNAMGPIDLESSGDLWTPLVFGSRAVLHILGSGNGVDTSIEIDKIAELTTNLRSPEPTVGACVTDIMCSTPLNEVPEMAVPSSATALIAFIEGGQVGICTGGLISQANTSEMQPYVLTANHCIASNAVAGTAEFFFDYYAASCSAAAPNLETLPRVSRATVLATAEYGDYSLLRMAAKPASGPNSRWYLGWWPRDFSQDAGTQLYRVSHPGGEPQKYSRHSVLAVSQTCQSLPRGAYVYSVTQVGGTEGGSSGAPTFIRQDGNHYIVGQLLGKCGPALEDVCNPQT